MRCATIPLGCATPPPLSAGRGPFAFLLTGVPRRQSLRVRNLIGVPAGKIASGFGGALRCALLAGSKQAGQRLEVIKMSSALFKQPIRPPPDGISLGHELLGPARVGVRLDFSCEMQNSNVSQIKPCPIPLPALFPCLRVIPLVKQGLHRAENGIE